MVLSERRRRATVCKNSKAEHNNSWHQEGATATMQPMSLQYQARLRTRAANAHDHVGQDLSQQNNEANTQHKASNFNLSQSTPLHYFISNTPLHYFILNTPLHYIILST